jgi:hypothetical protein
MNKLFLLICLVASISCDQKKSSILPEENEFHLKVFDKMNPDKILCSGKECISEQDLYIERGNGIYALEDQLFYLKYKMAKELLIQRLVDKKLQATGLSFSEYNSKLRASTKITDQEVSDFVKKLDVGSLSPENPKWNELKKKLIDDKLAMHYEKLLTEGKGIESLHLKLTKKERRKVDFDFNKLVTFKSVVKPDLNVTIVFNPMISEYRNLLIMIDSLSNHFSRLGKKINWFYLPFSDSSELSASYQKFFICSQTLDKGVSFLSLMSVNGHLRSEKEMIDFAKTRKFNTNKLNTCLSDKKTISKLNQFADQMKKSQLGQGRYIVYDNEVESHISGLLEMSKRIEMKLKLKSILPKY